MAAAVVATGHLGVTVVGKVAALAESSRIVVQHGHNRSSPSHRETAPAEFADSNHTCSRLSLQYA
eukprot:CAMPEP_0172714656 /NCGR_PEP_ID=MMETSP1074-20121228/66442_1 /TAXON_ID=2916 /ORGANISM="Ceratium fusus, Strain PA161109" /LENGTH=64 /DNA_ID=CAMNT_0013539119 /DNA_START=127 /DNA_END=321 /DNA_ORIENTATION=-